VARSTLRRGQGYSLLALAAVCALSGTLVAGASYPESPKFDLAARKGFAAAATRSSTPVIQPSLGSSYPQPPSGYAPNGGTYSPIHQDVTRAKVTFDLPKVIMLVEEHFTPHPQPNPRAWFDVDALVYVASPLGVDPAAGVFPPVTVTTLGFGMLPVTATVHITQVRDASGPVPLNLHFSFTGQPDAGWQDEGPLSMAGKVDVRISDVVVDQVPVSVGSNCHTAVPATLDFEANAGRYVQSTGVRDPPDLFLPAATVPGSVHGTVDVPAFTGCLNGDEDLSPLITSMVSASGNPITATQIGPLGKFIPPTS